MCFPSGHRKTPIPAARTVGEQAAGAGALGGRASTIMDLTGSSALWSVDIWEVDFSHKSLRQVFIF